MSNNSFQEKKLYFVKKVALEYRLSMKNICRLLKVEPTDENIKLLYDEMMKLSPKQEDQRAFNWLVVSTTNENEKDSNTLYHVALAYLGQVTIATQSGDEKQIEEAYNRLFKIDTDFRNLVTTFNPRSIKQEDMLIIAKYRIKYALSKAEVAKMIGINRDTVSKNERKHLLENPEFSLEYKRVYDRLVDLNEMIANEIEQRYPVRK